MAKPKDGLYALYLRKSRADLEREKYGEFETLAIHELDMIAVAKREGYVLDKPYYKELVSGEHIAERYEFQKLMRKVENGEYRGILVHEVSRLGRGEPMEYGYVLFTLKRTKTLIITMTRCYDPNNPDDFRSLQTEMFLSNMELGNTRWRLTNGSRSRAGMGCFVKSRAAVGYDRVKINGLWTLKENEFAPTIKLIFKRAADGTPYGTIASDLNKAGLRTPSGGFWCASRITTIIKNPVYKGKIRYGYYHKELIPTDGFNYTIKNTYNDDFILVDGLHEALISEEIWEAANNKNNGSSRKKKDYDLKNPLAGLLVCKKCGRALLRFVNTCRSNGNKIEHYRHPRFCDCHTQGIRLSVVVDTLCEALESIASDIEAQEASSEVDTTKEELATIEKQLAKEARKLEKLFDLYIADAISVEEFKSMRSESEELQATLEERKEKLSGKKKTPQEVVFTIREAIAKLKDDDVSAQAKNIALRAFIKSIEYENFTKPRSHDYDLRLNIIFKE